MNVLIPGGAGYVGSVLVPYLVEAGHQVSVYDTAQPGTGDVRDADAFRLACEGKEAVIYLASISNNDTCVKEPIHSFAVNIQAMYAIPRIAAAAGVKRFIYASSVAGYPAIDEPCKETVGLRHPTPYALGKLCAEGSIRGQIEGWTIVRSASVCGYAPRMRYDLTVNKMVHDALRYGRIKVNGGQQKRSHIHILDLCDFYLLLLDLPREKSSGEVFNVVAENQSVLETAELVIRTLAPNARRARNMPAFIEVGETTDDRSYTVDGTKAREVLGFAHKRTVADAVRDIAAHFEVSRAA